MSTLPAEMVRLGSIWRGRIVETSLVEGEKIGTYDDRYEWVLILLIRDLRIYVDAGQPTCISRMRMVPSDSVLQASDLAPIKHRFIEVTLNAKQPYSGISTYLLTPANILDHVLVRRLGGVHARLGSLHGQREGVHDDESVAYDLALHEAHDLPWHA